MQSEISQFLQSSISSPAYGAHACLFRDIGDLNTKVVSYTPNRDLILLEVEHWLSSPRAYLERTRLPCSNANDDFISLASRSQDSSYEGIQNCPKSSTGQRKLAGATLFESSTRARYFDFLKLIPLLLLRLGKCRAALPICWLRSECPRRIVSTKGSRNRCWSEILISFPKSRHFGSPWEVTSFNLLQWLLES